MNKLTRMGRASIPVLLILPVLAACGGGAQPTATTAPTQTATEVPPTAESTLEMTQEAMGAESAAVTPESSEMAPTEESTMAVEATAEATGEAGQAASGDTMIRIEQDNSGLRAGPGVSYPRISQAGAGDLFPALGKSGEGQTLWYELQMPDGTSSWVWSKVASVVPEDAEIPVVEPPPTPSS